ncbi:sodium:solute symporter [Egicoccus sp. AB-alg6-2]|uniref:sodium:solute symporter family transporter n=1 Tax=Egicoccus sp. AB-alg6-2 TaxID=3242692 RepID=UPI00359EDB05
MVATSLSVLLLGTVLAAFVVIGVRAGREVPRADLDDFTVARGSQGPLTLGLSFLASGLGAWILFAPPELGAILGIGPVIGYAVAAAGPFLVFAFVGPRLRRIVPSGQGLSEFLRVRFGRSASRLVTAVSLLYMGVFVAAELVAIGGLVELLGGIPRQLTVVAVVAATLTYTTYGGLRASLRTDRWQSWLVIVLLTVAAVAAVVGVDGPVASVRDSGLLGIDRVGLKSAATLILAVTAANLFHHGYWQRVWSARDDRALRQGALVGAAVTIPLMLIAGGLGVLSASVGLAEVPALSIFVLAAELPGVVVAVVLVLGIALVASSVDTLENGLAALLVSERPSLRLGHARLLTVAVMLPALAVGLVATSVLQLFLIADLLAAVLLLPALLGLWRRTTTTAVWSGIVAGAVGALGAGLLAAGSLEGAVARVTFPDAVPTLAPFAGALLASGLVTFLVSLGGRPTVELSELDARVRERVPAAGPPSGA